MRPVYLEFFGINSFSSKTQIDFRPLLKGGVFGIFGDTGSGKSTILDSIHFALYGKVDRASGSFESCINHHGDVAGVTFDFEITDGGVRKAYRVQREYRRSGRSKAFFYEYTQDNGLFALAEGTRDVNAAIEKKIGLTFEDFKTCIALPQGDFAALVKATSGDRIKLIAHLFNLEKYGEQLSKAINAKYYEAEDAVRVVQAKMGENEGASEETLALKKQEIAATEDVLSALIAELAAKEKTLREVKERTDKKAAYEQLCKELQTKNAELSQMQEKRKLIEREPLAKAVTEKSERLQKLRASLRECQLGAAQKKSLYEQAVKQLEVYKVQQQSRDFDKEILECNLKLQKLSEGESLLAAEKDAKRALEDCRKQYALLAAACKQEPFDETLAGLEKEMDALGNDGTLLDYIQHTYKGVMLAQTYAEFTADLQDLAQKHPTAQPDIARLIDKYTVEETDGELPDVEKVNAAFKAISEKKKLLQKQLDDTRKRQIAYLANEEKKNNIKQQGELLRANYENACERTAQLHALGSKETLEGQLEALENQKRQAQAAVDTATERANILLSEYNTKTQLALSFAQQEKEGETALRTSLRENGFASVDEASDLLARLGDSATAKEQTDTFFKRFDVLKAQIESTDTSVFATLQENAYTNARLDYQQTALKKDETLSQKARLQSEYNRLLILRERYLEYEKELTQKQKYKELCDELRLLVRSNRFLEFIASEYLQEICLAAGKTLLSLTGGRYFLKYEDKEFKVGDNLDGGNLRAVKTLSGGETFLVSLSLALSLSAAICAKSLRPIEFFFLDEGFGTLDGQLVETVMDVLGKLSKSFAVGLISHVEELKHRIDNKILVTGATESHGSTVRVECF
ncbi:MAG: SMC family ATPase [Clostridia bacterium]|nr:SMC family ATPase [Clostridia bacterium]